MRGFGEVGRGFVRRGLAAGVETAVVLDADGEVGGEVVRGDVRGFFGVDGDGGLVFVGWAGGYGEHVVVCHVGRFWVSVVRGRLVGWACV